MHLRDRLTLEHFIISIPGNVKDGFSVNAMRLYIAIFPWMTNESWSFGKRQIMHNFVSIALEMNTRRIDQWWYHITNIIPFIRHLFVVRSSGDEWRKVPQMRLKSSTHARSFSLRCHDRELRKSNVELPVDGKQCGNAKEWTLVHATLNWYCYSLGIMIEFPRRFLMLLE